MLPLGTVACPLYYAMYSSMKQSRRYVIWKMDNLALIYIITNRLADYPTFPSMTALTSRQENSLPAFFELELQS